jgi:hypothetical protein
LAPVPLYTSAKDCHEAIERLKVIMMDRDYEGFPPERALIT